MIERDVYAAWSISFYQTSVFVQCLDVRSRTPVPQAPPEAEAMQERRL